MDTLFLPLSLGLLALLMGVCAWWGIHAYKRGKKAQCTIAVLILLVLGFGWQYFPTILFLILAPMFGWSFSM